MVLRVHVIERDAGCGKGFELRGDLGFQLFSNHRQKEVAHSGGEEVSCKAVFAVDQMWYALRWKARPPVYQDDVQTDGQPS